jgi:transcriptional regulator with GAF, ATPase, and Fis domain
VSLPPDLELVTARARQCLERWEPAAARQAAEQARSMAAGWGDAAGVALADVLLARASLLISPEPSARLLPSSVRRPQLGGPALGAAIARFELELAAACRRAPGATVPESPWPELPPLTADSPLDLVAAAALAAVLRFEDAGPAAAPATGASSPPATTEDRGAGWRHLVEAAGVEARGGDGLPAIDGACRVADHEGNRALLWTALQLRAAVSGRRGDQAEQAAARARLVGLLETWESTLPPAEAPSARLRPDRARARAWSSGGATAAPLPSARLIDVALMLAQERDVARLVDLALDAAIEATQAERGVLLLLDPGRRYRIAATRYVDDDPAGRELLGLSSTIARRAIEGGEVVVSADVRRDARFEDCASVAVEVTGVLCAPIHARAELEGAIYLDRRAHGRGFEEPAVAAVRAIGGMLATALLNARTIDSLETRTRELEVAREALSLALERRTVERDDISRQLADIEDVVPAGVEAIIGRAPVMLRMRRIIQSFAASDAPVLVAGETGSGKDLVARAIHASSSRRDGPFVVVNCGALSETLLAAELFGVERGAYTGATASRPGLFLAAHGGTLFLDEIGDMPPAMQTALLRVLETSDIRPVGAVKSRKVDVRVVAASHRDLVDLVRQGAFRDDLRYRLEVVRIEVPALRDRLEDLPELCEHLLREVRRRYGLPNRRLSAEALRALALRRWPGNVRELRHVLASAALSATEPSILPADLPPERAASPGPPATPGAAETPGPIDIDGHAVRVDSIRRALKATAGHRAKAAQLLGISRSTFYRYLDVYAIDVGEFDLPATEPGEP